MPATCLRSLSCRLVLLLALAVPAVRGAESASRFAILPEADAVATVDFVALRNSGFYQALQAGQPEAKKAEGEWLALMDLKPEDCPGIVASAKISLPDQPKPPIAIVAIDSLKPIDMATVLKRNQEKAARQENKTLSWEALPGGRCWRLANADDPSDQLFLALSLDARTLFISPGRQELEEALARETANQPGKAKPAVAGRLAGRQGQVRFACVLPDEVKKGLRGNGPAPQKTPAGGNGAAATPDAMGDLAQLIRGLEGADGDVAATGQKLEIRLNIVQPTAEAAEKGGKTLQATIQFLGALMALSGKDPEMAALAPALQRLACSSQGAEILVAGSLNVDECGRLAALGQRLEAEKQKKAERRGARRRDDDVDVGQ